MSDVKTKLEKLKLEAETIKEKLAPWKGKEMQRIRKEEGSDVIMRILQLQDRLWAIGYKIIDEKNKIKEKLWEIPS